MLYVQRLGFKGKELGLVIGGVTHLFDAIGFYNGRRDTRYINLEPVRVDSYITQVTQCEKVSYAHSGKETRRGIESNKDVMVDLENAKTNPNCIGVVNRTLTEGNITGTQYLVIWKDV